MGYILVPVLRVVSTRRLAKRVEPEGDCVYQNRQSVNFSSFLLRKLKFLPLCFSENIVLYEYHIKIGAVKFSSVQRCNYNVINYQKSPAREIYKCAPSAFVRC